MTERKIVFRHGDVTLHQVSEEPQVREIIAEGNNIVIAEGEATGHHHRLLGEQVMVMKGFDDKTYIKITKPTKLVHEEHNCLTILPGIYRQEQEVEYDYFEKTMKNVRD